MFAAILICGASVCMTSCGDNDDPLLSKEYSFDCTLEMITQGDLTDKDVTKLESNINRQKGTNKFNSLFDAKNALDNVVDELVIAIKNDKIYTSNSKYIIYVRLYDSQKYQVYQRVITVDGEKVTVG
jgi:hypothetical protein